MEQIQEQLKKVINELFGVEASPVVTEAPEGMKMADGEKVDYSSNVAMALTRELKRNPREIATEIADKMPEYKTEVAGPGFLNFRLSDAYFWQKNRDFAHDFEKNISCDEYSGKTIVCEFSDPNPFKVLHVGHLYTSIVGDSISRLFEYAGAKVIRANFGGDVGLHVGKTIWALEKSGMEDFTIEDVAAKYVEGTRAYDDDETAHAEITALNKEIYEINKNNLHDSHVAEIYWKGREMSYDYFKDFYARIGLKFDKFYPESTVAELGLETVKKQLEAGVYEMSDGAVVFRGENFKLHTRVFINKEGVPTYESKDVGLIFTKWNDWHFDKSVVITANEQLDYMKVVLKSIEQYAPDLVAKTLHLTHGIVKLPGSVKMSSRKGNFLRAVDVLDVVSEELKEGYNSEDFTVALGAVKYAFLKYRMGGDIIFDPKESVKMTGNSGPYLQYSCVRAKKILEKIGKKEARADYEVNEHEKALIKKFVQYKDVLLSAVTDTAPQKVANYLYELAQEFSRFYENCPVAGSDAEAERGEIVSVFLKIMTHGLDLLGIKVPEEM